MEFDWPQFPAKVAHFIETGEVMHSARVGKPKLVSVEIKIPYDADGEPLAWWEICFLLGCSLALSVCVLLVIIGLFRDGWWLW